MKGFITQEHLNLGNSILKRMSLNLLLIFGGCLVGFLIVEMALHIFNPFDFRVKGDKIILPANREYKIEVEYAEKLINT